MSTVPGLHEVELCLRAYGGSQVKIGGTDVSNATESLALHASGRELPSLTLNIVVPEFRVKGEDVTVQVSQETADLLVKLGWTPPPSTNDERKAG